MVDANHLRIVFRLNDVDFVMPVAELLAIKGADEDGLKLCGSSPKPFQVGALAYRGTDIQVYDLAVLFEITEADHPPSGPLLVFSGADYPWAVRVDHVVGVFDETGFLLQDLPEYFFRDGSAPYHQVALHDGQILISVDAQQLDLVWRRVA